MQAYRLRATVTPSLAAIVLRRGLVIIPIFFFPRHPMKTGPNEKTGRLTGLSMVFWKTRWQRGWRNEELISRKTGLVYIAPWRKVLGLRLMLTGEVKYTTGPA